MKNKKNDKLALDKFCKELINYCKDECQFHDNSFVVSLNGKFGSGKSWFLEMMHDSFSEGKDRCDKN